MANKNTETKVVQMRFDNRDFEKKINATIKSVNALDDSLQFKGSKKELEELSKTIDKIEADEINKNLKETDNIIHKISVSFKELLKIKLLSKAIDTVTRSAKNLFTTVTGFNNVIAGWEAYNESLVTVGGILNQINDEENGLNRVAQAMDNLRWYADETSYSFQTMSDGIRQFVIAGIDLEAATSAVQGVANLAGSAKVFDPYKVQSAMDAISKSMQTGYMDVMKWTSLTNTAGVVTQEFSQRLLETAAAQGTLVKSAGGQYKTKKGGMLVTPENIRETLSKKWLTKDVLTAVLNDYNSATETVQSFMSAVGEGSAEAWEIANKYFAKTGKTYQSLDDVIAEVQNNPKKYSEQVVKMTENMTAENLTTRQAIILMNELGVEFDKVSYKAFLSSQETTSFAQAVSYASGAIKTSWQGIFQAIFGDVEKATALWSDVSDKFYDIFVAPFNLLEDKVGLWSELENGGAADFREVILSLIDVLGRFREAISEGFKAVFNGDIVSTLQNVTLKLKDFTNNLKNNETLFNTITAISKIFAAALKVIGTLLSSIFKIAGAVLNALSPVFDLIANGLTKLADGIVWLIKFIDEIGILKTIIAGITKTINKLGQAIKKVAQVIKSKINVEKIGESFKKAFGWLSDKFGEFIDWIAELIDKFADWIKEAEIAEKIAWTFGKTLNFLKSIFEKMAVPFKALIGMFKNFSFGGGFKKSTEETTSTGNGFIEWVKNTWGKFVDMLEKSGLMKYFEKIKEFFVTIGDFFKTLFAPLTKAIHEGDTKTIIKWLLGILSIVTVLIMIKRYADIFLGAKKLLSSIADMFWALEARFRVGIFKSITSGVLQLAIAVGVLAYSIGMIVKLAEDGKKLWMSVGVIGILIVFIAALTILLSLLGKKGIGVGGVKTILQLVGMAVALSLVMKSMAKAMETVKDVNMSTIGKAILVMASVSVIFSIVMLASRFGITTPLIISFIKVLGSIWLMIKMAFWVMNTAKGYSESDIDRFQDIMYTMILAFIVVFALTRNVGRVIPGQSVIQIGSSLLSIAAIIFAISQVIKITKGMTEKDIKHMREVFTWIFSAVVVLATGLIAASFIPQQKVASAALRVGGTMTWISLSVIAMAVALRIVKGIGWSDIISATPIILGVYAILGILAIALTKVSQLTSKTTKIGKFGKSTGISSSKTAMASSPIGMTILAITASMALAMVMIKYAKDISWEDFISGYGKIMLVLGSIALMAAILMLITKIPTGKNESKAVVKLKGTMIVALLAIIAIAFVITTLAGLDEGALKRGGIAAGIIAISILAFSALITLISLIGKHNTAKQVKRNAAQMAMTLAAIIIFVGALFAIAQAIKILGAIPTEELIKGGITAGIIMAALLVMMVAINLISKIGNIKDKLVGLLNLITIVSALLILAFALNIIATIPTKDLIKAGIAIIAMLTILIIAVGILGGLGESGIGIIGVLLLLAIAAALWIMAKAMTEIAPVLDEFGAFFETVGNTIASVVERILAAIGDLITTIIDSLSGAIHQANEDLILLLNTLKDMDYADLSKLYYLAGGLTALGLAMVAESGSGLLSSITNFFSGGDPLKKIINSLNAFDENKLGLFNKFVEMLKALPDSMKEINTNLEPYKKAMSQVFDPISGLAFTIAQNETGINSIKDLFSKLFNFNIVNLSIAIAYLDKIQEVLNSDFDIQPTITPVFDLSQFEAGMSRMRYDFSTLPSYYSAAAAQSDYNAARSGGSGRGGVQMDSAMGGSPLPSIIFNNTQNFNDGTMYSYSATRSTQNMLESAVQGFKNGVKYVGNSIVGAFKRR